MTGIINVRIALETALSGMTPSLPTAWENWPFEPCQAAYQKVNLLVAEPDNSEFGANYREQGIFQVTLMYPLETGPEDSGIRAELLRQTFPRGASFTSGSVTVVVDRTPEISAGSRDGDKWSVPVRIRWHAHVSV